MPYYLVKDFVRGLDVRRMIETTEAGSLIKAQNCVITRGGEIERRRAWNRIIELPPNTFGLWYEAGIPGVWHVFGSGSAPVMPPHTQYHQLIHPDGLAMTAVRCVREFNKKLFVAAEYSDASVLCFYNDLLVIEDNTPETPPDEEDPPTQPPPDPYPVGHGRATASARIVRNSAAAGSITGIIAFRSGVSGVYSWQFKLIVPTGTTIAIASTDTAAAIAIKVRDAINAAAATNFFHASVTDDTVIVSFADAGEDNNGWTLSIARTADLFALDPTLPVFYGGQNTVTSSIVDVARGQNPRAVSTHWSPGQFALQHNQKMFAVAGDSGLLNVSAINAPDMWSPDATGAGFIDMSQQAGARSNLVSLAQFQGKLAVFAFDAVFVWYMDPDLAASSQVSVLDNTGAIAPRSVQSFGNSDVFYLSPTGIRSLQSRDVTGEAFASDIGNPIDTLVQAAIEAAGYSTFLADAAIDPYSGRYVLCLGGQLFVFNFFAQTKIAAWTTWALDFEVKDLITGGGRMWARSTDAIYVYGDMTAMGAPDRYDDCPVIVQLPFLNASKPAHPKSLFGLDVAAQNTWTVEMGIDYNQPDFMLPVGVIDATTYREQRVGLSVYTTHVSFKLTCTTAGYARLGNLAFHFNEGEEAG